ncbi:hypothetical protein P2318_20880 [Myxococcaceae bacterium GXIMD 01537]
MSLSTLEAYDLIRFTEAFEARLASADELLAGREGLETEKAWLATAIQLVSTARKPSSALLARVKDLPELDEAREEFAFEQQNRWVDALEKLHAGITFCASSRSPVIDALFPHLKFPQLRRAPREAVTEYVTSYERRLKSSYVTRIIAHDDFSFVRPVIEVVARSYASWMASLEPISLSEEEALPLREELVDLGKVLDVAVRQARLLAEAAFVPIPGAFDATNLAAKPRRRPGRGLPLAPEDLAPSAEGAPETEPLVDPEAAPAAPPVEAAPSEAAPEPVVEAESPAPEAPPPAEAAPAPTEPPADAPAEAKPSRRGRKKAAPKASAAEPETT